MYRTSPYVLLAFRFKSYQCSQLCVAAYHKLSQLVPHYNDNPVLFLLLQGISNEDLLVKGACTYLFVANYIVRLGGV